MSMVKFSSPGVFGSSGMCNGPFSASSSSSSSTRFAFNSVLLRVGVSVLGSENVLLAGESKERERGRSGTFRGVCPALVRYSGGGGDRVLRVAGGVLGSAGPALGIW